MRRKRRDLGQSSDIAFLLIIFFLLLAGINTSQSLELTTSATSSLQTDKEFISALLTENGTLIVQGIDYTPLEFATKLSPNTALTLHIEEETSYQQVIDILSLAEQHQIASLSLEVAL